MNAIKVAPRTITAQGVDRFSQYSCRESKSALSVGLRNLFFNDCRRL